MRELTVKQQASLAFFNANLKDWLNDRLKAYKYVIIREENIEGLYDTVDGAVEFVINNDLEPGDYIIQRVMDESISFIRPAVV